MLLEQGVAAERATKEKAEEWRRLDEKEAELYVDLVSDKE